MGGSRNVVDTPNSADTALPEAPSKRSSHYDRAKEEKDFLLTEFFGKLPKLPSHYCRKTSSKLYLESHFRSLAELHKEYLRRCADFGKKGLGLTLFKEEFYKCNLALHQPRKDLCDICVSHSVGNLDDKTWQEHMQLKEKALAIKEQDKKAAIEDTTGIAAICMDLESVLLAPALQAAALYYKTKLTVHNFTVYDLATKDVLCYVWHEGEGALTGNEFASCVIDYLENKVSADKIFIFSDGCVYQNKNSTLANAISDFCARRNKIVEHKYLIKGHTHMEVDSCHSLIERALKGRAIYVPHDYVTVFENARRVPRPFEVKYLDHTFFKDFSKLCTYKSIRQGRGKGDPQVNDIRCLKYSADRNIQFKLSFDDDWADIPKPRVQGTESVEAPSALYSDRLKIPESKFKHLQELKCVLPKDHHHFYDNLRH